MLGKGIPFGVRKHEIKHEPRKKKKKPRSESKPQSWETTAEGTSQECEPEGAARWVPRLRGNPWEERLFCEG